MFLMILLEHFVPAKKQDLLRSHRQACGGAGWPRNTSLLRPRRHRESGGVGKQVCFSYFGQICIQDRQMFKIISVLLFLSL